MGERILRNELVTLRGASGVAVSSVGTHAVVGADMDPEARATLVERGLDPAGFVARQLEPAHIASADLVLTATRQHRGEVLGMAPLAMRRAFTIRELARLSTCVTMDDAADELAGIEQVRARIAAAAAARGESRPDFPDDDDIVDPYRQPPAAFRACAELLARDLSVVSDLLLPRRD